MTARLFALLVLSSIFWTPLSNAEKTQEIVIERSPFPAYLYHPNSPGPHPAIVFLHGSGGGNGDFWYEPGERPRRTGEDSLVPRIAKHYARLGYVTMALCYFDCRHHQGFSSYPPDELVNVDIKATTEAAISWLRDQPFSRGKKIGVWGGSRGAEHSILYGSLVSKDSKGYPDAIASLSPSDYVSRQFTLETARAIINGETPRWPRGPAWKYGEMTPEIERPIKIEEYQGPLLLSYFTTDPSWGRWVDLRRTLGRFENANIPFFLKEFNPSDSSAAALSEIQNRENDKIFIQYNFSGHVHPDDEEYPNAFLLQVTAVEWFFEKYLR